jgi:hypothetical protein
LDFFVIRRRLDSSNSSFIGGKKFLTFREGSSYFFKLPLFCFISNLIVDRIFLDLLKRDTIKIGTFGCTSKYFSLLFQINLGVTRIVNLNIYKKLCHVLLLRGLDLFSNYKQLEMEFCLFEECLPTLGNIRF